MKKKRQKQQKKKKRATHSIRIDFAEANVTAFGGVVLAERLASRLSLWTQAEKLLPMRSGLYSWLDVLKTATAGLLTGAKGTFATEEVRRDAALLNLIDVAGAPEEATFWRSLEQLGEMQKSGVLPEINYNWVRKILGSSPRNLVMCDGFLPVFLDGSLLEGSPRREGTKTLSKKGAGLIWTTCFVGPLLAAQRLAGEGEGEQSCARAMLPDVVEKVLKPLRLRDRALVLADSLHGDGPTLDDLEGLGLRYVIGANKLKATEATLAQQSEVVWSHEGPNASLQWSDSGLCVCWLQCADWPQKRLLVGRRWMKEGEFIWNYSGLITNLTETDVSHICGEPAGFAQAIWRLYDRKMGMETHYKDALSDLGLHHPPCQEIVRNAGFYAVASLAHTLGVGVDLLGSANAERGSDTRKDGAKRKRPRPARMRLWRLCRRLFTLPAQVVRHSRVLRVTLLGVSEVVRREFEAMFRNLARS